MQELLPQPDFLIGMNEIAARIGGAITRPSEELLFKTLQVGLEQYPQLHKLLQGPLLGVGPVVREMDKGGCSIDDILAGKECGRDVGTGISDWALSIKKYVLLKGDDVADWLYDAQEWLGKIGQSAKLLTKGIDKLTPQPVDRMIEGGAENIVIILVVILVVGILTTGRKKKSTTLDGRNK